MESKTAVSKYNFTIKHFNIKTPKGAKARKNYEVKAGEKFEIINKYLCHNIAMWGNPVLELKDPRGNGYRLFAEESYFDISE